MNTAEEPSSPEGLLSLVKDALAGGRDPAHLFGLVRGLEIGISTLSDHRCRRAALIKEMKKRSVVLSKVGDNYHDGAAHGIDLSVSFATRLTKETQDSSRVSAAVLRSA
ncbi:MAG: hypothetical protein LC808_24135 [Actinobacteria bacterium]|nr:hypothetical protein [Actinomycetota bacterium]